MLIPGRWVLDDPQGSDDWLDPSQLTSGQPVRIDSPMTIGLLKSGSPLDYSISPMGVPVVTEKAASVLVSVCSAEVQLIEVAVEDHQGNATRSADCVDEEQSRGVEMWTEQDGRPDRMGEYRSIFKLQIDPRRTLALDYFRVARFPVALIVSERLKRAMEEANLLGPAFVPVTETTRRRSGNSKQPPLSHKTRKRPRCPFRRSRLGLMRMQRSPFPHQGHQLESREVASR